MADWVGPSLLGAAGDMPTFAASNYAANTFNFIPEEKLNNLFEQPKHHGALQQVAAAQIAQIKETKMASRRMVQVLIVDPNENIPLDKCLIYEGEPKLTDATDQELFFELDIKSLLAAHNEQRVKFIDKKIKDRTEYLEAAKVRDLKMVVVKIAEF